MKEVRRKHAIETVVKLQEYKRRHVDLTQRVIQVNDIFIQSKGQWYGYFFVNRRST
jgi:hypothetical protein